jgi:SAM-dependent methyltransferase
MQLDVTELRDFYATPLGQVARRLVAQRIRARWRSLSGGTLIGLGFASPYLGAFRNEAARVGVLMPSSQGALVWPRSGSVLTALCEDGRLPLLDNSVDRLLLMHGLETTESVSRLLREIWRVMVPEGRLLIVVPNRSGAWAHLDATPFGTGRPYSRSQLETLLSQSLFTPVEWDSALHLPPFNRRLLLRSAGAWERAGSRLWPALAGVLIVEAQKETLASIGGGVKARRAAASLVTLR